jgi:hypothetical protein
MSSNVDRSWEEFLNPETMRPRLIAASIYIAVFEMLKDTIEERIRDFFLCFNEATARADPEYQSCVAARNKSLVYASLDWLKEMGAINDADMGTFSRVKDCRNALAHDLLSMLGSEGLPVVFEECFAEMVELTRKIEVWWITNVDIPANPTYDESKVDEEMILPGRIALVQFLLDIALGDEKRSRFYLDEFHRRSAQR